MPIQSRKHPAQRPSFQPGRLATATLASGLALALPSLALASDPANPANPTSPSGAASAAAAATDGGDRVTTLRPVEVQGDQGPLYGGDRSDSPKFPRALVDTPQTIQVIGSDLFEEQGATTLTEALRNSPGVGTFYAGENGSTTTGDGIQMRGFDSAGSIFVDGVRDLGSVSRDVFNIERIEVAKGPAGTDNGRTAPTGAIDLVTKQPGLRDAASASLSWGSADQRRGTADWNQRMGEGSAFRLNLMAQDSAVPGRDVVRQKRWGVAPSLAFGLGSPTRVYLDLLHVDQSGIPDGGVPTIGLPGYSSPDPARPQIGDAPRVDPSSFYGTTSDHDDVAIDMATLRLEHDFASGAMLRNTLRWGRNRQDYLLTSFMASADPARFATPDLDDPTTWTLARSLPTFKDQANTILANQSNLSLHAGEGRVQHDLSLGVELMREALHTRGVAALDGSAWPSASLYAPDPDVTGLAWAPNGARGDGRTDTVAAYAFDTISLGERWLLAGGVRLDHYRTRFDSLVPCGGRRGPDCGGQPEGTILPGVDARVSDTLANWKLGLVYKPTGDSSVYANLAVSRQPPGGASLELSDRANSADNPAFEPQTARTAEVGGKWSLHGDRLLLTAALYDTRVGNELVQDPVDQQYYQVGRKRVRGVELGAVGRLTEAWSVSAGYTVMDATVERGSAAVADGSDALPYTPRTAFTAWTTWQASQRLRIGGGVRHTGSMKRGTDGAVGTPATVSGWWVFDAVASYAATEHLDVRLNLYNLADADYVASINKSGYRYTPGAPRSAMLTLDASF